MTTTPTAEEVRAELLGSWRLVSCESIKEDGAVDHPLGEHPVGQLMYDHGNRMSAQLTRVDRPRFASENWGAASEAEISAAWPGYFGYFGTFTIDTEAEAITHHIAAGAFPNLAATSQVRHYRFEGRRLILEANGSWGRTRAIWEKLASP